MIHVESSVLGHWMKACWALTIISEPQPGILQRRFFVVLSILAEKDVNHFSFVIKVCFWILKETGYTYQFQNYQKGSNFNSYSIYFIINSLYNYCSLHIFVFELFLLFCIEMVMTLSFPLQLCMILSQFTQNRGGGMFSCESAIGFTWNGSDVSMYNTAVQVIFDISLLVQYRYPESSSWYTCTFWLSCSITVWIYLHTSVMYIMPSIPYEIIRKLL